MIPRGSPSQIVCPRILSIYGLLWSSLLENSLDISLARLVHSKPDIAQETGAFHRENFVVFVAFTRNARCRNGMEVLQKRGTIIGQILDPDTKSVPLEARLCSMARLC